MDFAAPLALAALVVPALVLALALAPRRPQRAETGALELWRLVARASPRGGARRSWRPPAWIVVTAAGLCAWALALAAPSLGAIEREEWRVLVDRRALMLLESRPGHTRLEDACVALLAALRERAGDVRVRWSSPGLADVITRARDAAPIEHFRAAPVAARSPDFKASDEAGVVWLTASQGTVAPTRAGRVASGGAAVPGFVASNQDGWVFWDGAQLETRAAPSAAGALIVDAAAPELVRDFAASYAEARGFVLEGEATQPARLVVRVPPERGAELDGAYVVAAGRRIAELNEGAACKSDVCGVVLIEALDRTGRRAPLAVAESGVLTVAPGTWLELDPIDLALGLGAVFDAALAPDARLVPVEGRRDQGETLVALGEAPPPTPTPLELRAGLALVSALCFALAAWLRRA